MPLPGGARALLSRCAGTTSRAARGGRGRRDFSRGRGGLYALCGRFLLSVDLRVSAPADEDTENRDPEFEPFHPFVKRLRVERMHSEEDSGQNGGEQQDSPKASRLEQAPEASHSLSTPRTKCPSDDRPSCSLSCRSFMCRTYMCVFYMCIFSFCIGFSWGLSNGKDTPSALPLGRVLRLFDQEAAARQYWQIWAGDHLCHDYASRGPGARSNGRFRLTRWLVTVDELFPAALSCRTDKVVTQHG